MLQKMFVLFLLLVILLGCVDPNMSLYPELQYAVVDLLSHMNNNIGTSQISQKTVFYENSQVNVRAIVSANQTPWLSYKNLTLSLGTYSDNSNFIKEKTEYGQYESIRYIGAEPIRVKWKAVCDTPEQINQDLQEFGFKETRAICESEDTTELCCVLELINPDLNK